MSVSHTVIQNRKPNKYSGYVMIRMTELGQTGSATQILVSMTIVCFHEELHTRLDASYIVNVRLHNLRFNGKTADTVVDSPTFTERACFLSAASHLTAGQNQR